MTGGTYGSIYTDNKNVIGYSSFDYTDKNNWFDSKFDGMGYYQKWNKNGLVRERYLTQKEWGVSMGCSMKIVLCRMKGILIPQETLDRKKEMEDRWFPKYESPPIRRHEQILCFYKKQAIYNPITETRGRVRDRGSRNKKKVMATCVTGSLIIC